MSPDALLSLAQTHQAEDRPSQRSLTLLNGGMSSPEALAPVILLGRGGSGTRMLSGLASRLGVFLGSDISATGDSLEWVETLYDLAVEHLTDEVIAGTARDAAWVERLRMRSADILSRASRTSDEPWGWKLPETMLCLSPVLRAFPEARVIHLVRHPVTSSLRRTHVTSRMDSPVGRSSLAAAYRRQGLGASTIDNDEAYLHNALTWAHQLQSAKEALDAAGTGVLLLRYEDLCADPSHALTRMARFLNAAPPASVEPDFAEAVRMNEVAQPSEASERVWAICEDIARHYGYLRS